MQNLITYRTCQDCGDSWLSEQGTKCSFCDSENSQLELCDRDKAILWARNILSKEFLILDTETTGLNGDGDDEVVSLGVIDQDGNVLIDTLLRHIKPSNPAALATHGHTWEETRLAPVWPEVLPRLREITAGRVIVSYCANNFDAGIIISTCKAHGTPILNLREQTHQALEPFAEFYGEYNDYFNSYRYQKLAKAAGYFEADTAGAHGAVADCKMTLEVLRGMGGAKLTTEGG